MARKAATKHSKEKPACGGEEVQPGRPQRFAQPELEELYSPEQKIAASTGTLVSRSVKGTGVNSESSQNDKVAVKARGAIQFRDTSAISSSVKRQ